MRITYDPDADAMYLRIQDTVGGDGHTDVTDAGVAIDYDRAGNAVGFELLTVRDKGIDLSQFPAVAHGLLQKLIDSGAIDRGQPFEAAAAAPG